MTSIRTIFIGTPGFSLPSLEGLLRDQFFNLVGVVTQPDRPSGRNLQVSETPVKKLSQQHKLIVHQPPKIRNYYDELAALKPDLIIVVAYGQLIPKSILDLPKYGCVNVHGSLLPKYRGAAVIQAPIINGDLETGVTIMLMDEGLDTGPILAQAKFDLTNQDTAASLFPKIAKLGAETLLPTMHRYINGSLKPVAQDEAKASYVKILKKDDAKINWTSGATEIERLVRAMSPWPIAWTTWSGKLLKIIEVENTPVAVNQYKPGQVFLNNVRLTVQCGINGLIIKRLQLEGKTEMQAEEFLRGQKEFSHALLT